MTKDPYEIFDEATVAHNEARNEALKVEAKRSVEDLKWLMSNARGRRIVYRILDDAGVFRISFNTDALQMAFNEGNRNSGLKILKTIVQHCPVRYAEMIEEATHAA